MGNQTETKLYSHEQSASLLPNRPYTAMNYHYGMLLGVDDFVTDQAYHRGKIRLHNAWLHGAGTIWGLECTAHLDRSELRLDPGLALDGYGRELHNDTPKCVNIVKWFAKHKDDPEFSSSETVNKITFEAHIIIRHRSCLMRPVPALLDTCEGTSSSTAYSRIHETVEILLKSGSVPTTPRRRNHLLRVLFGIDKPAEDKDGNILKLDREALDAREAILTAPFETRTAIAVEKFQKIAALDSIHESPAYDADDPEAYLFPEDAIAEVLLANINIQLKKEGDQWQLEKAEIDNLVRDTLLATASIQELIAGIGNTLYSSGSSIELGPRVKPESVKLNGTTLEFQVDKALNDNTVIPEVFTASQLVASGWQDISISSSQLTNQNKTVSVTLNDDPDGNVFRFVAIGTGSNPLMGENNLPLAGDIASSPNGVFGAMHGRDFVWMKNLGNS